MVYAGILNTQFLDGSNINYTFSGHDEYLTVREVYSILEPASFKHFAMSIAAGDVMFYGRMMFYTDAIVAYLPYKIGGISGLVYSIRMFHVLCLFFGLTLLGSTFLKNMLSRLIFYMSVLSLYYTSYFVMVPKPEPFQLLLIAVFIYYAYKRNWSFGRHFIWLGMAYGVKFNVLMILPLFFLLPIFVGQFNFKKCISSGILFCTGIIIAIPGLLLSPFKPQFLKTYIDSTFKNADHYDDTTVTIMDWLKDGLFKWYTGGTIIGVIVFAAFLFFITQGVIRYFKNKSISSELILSLVGLCLLLPVMILTKRLWAHYLWTGFVFLALGLLASAESNFRNTIGKKAAYAGLSLLMTVSVMFSIIKIYPLVKLEEQAKAIKSDSQKVYDYLNQKPGKISILQDITVRYPFTDFLAVSRYHPFAASYPYPIPDKSYMWNSFINPGNIQKQNANYLLTYKFNFESDFSENKSRKDEIIQHSYDKMKRELNKTIFPDTVFGEIHVYRVAND